MNEPTHAADRRTARHSGKRTHSDFDRLQP